MSPMTTIPTPQELSFDTNEKGNELLSVNSIRSTSPPTQNDTKDDDNHSRILSITLDEAGLHKIFLTSEYILLHLDDDPTTVVKSKCQELLDLAQQLKHLSVNTAITNNIYVNAILWMIYHCQASMAYHQKKYQVAIDACQTCLAIDLPITSESLLLLQKIKLMQVHTSNILEKCRLEQQCHRPSSIISDDDDSSSTSSSSGMMICSVCAVKKRTMPVCAQCKSRRYCGIKCLKLDKDSHSQYCLQR